MWLVYPFIVRPALVDAFTDCVDMRIIWYPDFGHRDDAYSPPLGTGKFPVAIRFVDV